MDNGVFRTVTVTKYIIYDYGEKVRFLSESESESESGRELGE